MKWRWTSEQSLTRIWIWDIPPSSHSPISETLNIWYLSSVSSWGLYCPAMSIVFVFFKYKGLQTQMWTKLINFHASGHYQKAVDPSSVSGRMWVKIERSRQRERWNQCVLIVTQRWDGGTIFFTVYTLQPKHTHTNTHSVCYNID